ncbi:MAG: homocysteine S-methyltransferase family protein [Planctomycetaceae bacterium]|nr:homocysteine S-methyltransferase family protein [Planctomycetaceae bacterium]
MTKSFRDRIQEPGTFLLDGATGTELSRRGFDTSGPSWTVAAIRECPDLLEQIHRDYVEAGAELITANTFRTQARSLVSLGWEHEAKELTSEAVEIARRAATDWSFVAGSVSPLADCYSPKLTPAESDLEREHREHARNLASAGVDLILVETQITHREAVIAARAAAETGVPFAVSFVTYSNGNLLSGESLGPALREIAELCPAAFLLNCIPAHEALATLRQHLHRNPDVRWGAYANTGRRTATGSWESTHAENPAVYAGFAKDWRESGLTWIGGCCGTTPEHISSLSKVL